ncbi:MAG: 3-deoxy-D-manno-octulosonic acid transferase [Kiritimatiellae bacterium]|nr:3-deoxy-D-manno-octulosonic acid transferase [Kiritimatiellia bacterium]
MKWLVYNLLFAAAYPFLLPGFLVRMLRRGGYAKRFGDRFALYPRGLFGEGRALFDSHAPYRPGPEGFVWIHAVSVGEVQVAGQLMREWRAAEPGVRFCFSTTSSTGWRVAEREVAPGDVLIYNPLDFPNFVKSALRTVRPRAVVLTESEIWPNFIRTARRFGIPLFLVNARVSDRSAPRYRLARWWFADVFASFSRIFAQSALDSDRLAAAGAPPGVLEVTGSFKFDAARRNEAKEAEMREWVGAGRVLLGGSTWPGEDAALLDAYAAALKAAPDLRLVIAPRHFEKADAVEGNIRRAGFECVRRSRGDAPRPGAVFLADTTGELMGLYGIADVVFVGKSLCAHGAQNMIEPCLCGKPTVVGPNTENFRPVMSDLRAAGAIAEVRDAAELARKVAELVADDGGLGGRAAAAVERRRGVVAKCVAEMREALR